MIDPYFQALDWLLKLRGFGQQDTAFRFAAVTCAGLERKAVLEAAAVLERKYRFVRPLSLAPAGIVVRRGLDPERVWREAKDAEEALLAAGFRHDHLFRTAAPFAFVLTGMREAKNAKSIFDLWKRDHWWLTGADDVALAVLHAGTGVDPATVAASTERIYRELRKLFWAGDDLQAASQILALGIPDATAAVSRFSLVLGALRDRRMALATCFAATVAILALAPGTPIDAARQFASDFERLAKRKPKPFPIHASCIAALLALRTAAAHRDLADVRTLETMVNR